MINLKRSKNVLWAAIAAGAGFVHLGTAALRMNSFFPTVQAVDFSSYYAAAWSFRLDMPLYAFSPGLLDFLAKTQDLTHTPPLCASSPLWIWLMQPMTALAFPSSAALWLLLNLMIACVCHVLLVRIAGYGGRKTVLATLPVTLSFGPLFLNLTLGQNALVLLLSALLMSTVADRDARGHKVPWIPVWILAVAAKIFPVLWVACPPFLRRWRPVLTASGLCLIVFSGFALLRPDANRDYGRRYLVDRAEQYAQGGTDIDDQSFKALVDRIGRPGHFVVHGLNVSERQEVTWELPWNMTTHSAYWATGIAAALIGLWLLYVWTRNRDGDPAGEFYSLLLFTLMFFPNMQRYNHVLALPAMAWLWRRGPGGRKLAIAAYALFALSRLNHLWAVVLPAPLAPLATGFGLFGVFTLLAGVIYFIQRKGEFHESCTGSGNAGTLG